MCKPRYQTLGESVKFMRGMALTVITCRVILKQIYDFVSRDWDGALGVRSLVASNSVVIRFFFFFLSPVTLSVTPLASFQDHETKREHRGSISHYRSPLPSTLDPGLGPVKKTVSKFVFLLTTSGISTRWKLQKEKVRGHDGITGGFNCDI